MLFFGTVDPPQTVLSVGFQLAGGRACGGVGLVEQMGMKYRDQTAGTFPYLSQVAHESKVKHQKRAHHSKNITKSVRFSSHVTQSHGLHQKTCVVTHPQRLVRTSRVERCGCSAARWWAWLLSRRCMQTQGRSMTAASHWRRHRCDMWTSVGDQWHTVC